MSSFYRRHLLDDLLYRKDDCSVLLWDTVINLQINEVVTFFIFLQANILYTIKIIYVCHNNLNILNQIFMVIVFNLMRFIIFDEIDQIIVFLLCELT